jgi:hypothetical protein
VLGVTADSILTDRLDFPQDQQVSTPPLAFSRSDLMPQVGPELEPGREPNPPWLGMGAELTAMDWVCPCQDD